MADQYTNGAGAPPAAAADDSGRKVFVGGLPPTTTEQVLREFCTEYGEVEGVKMMIDRNTGVSRGFAFVTFVSADTVQQLCGQGSVFKEIEGKSVEFKCAEVRGAGGAGGNEPNKVFVGGLPQSVTEDSFRSYFAQYGTVTDCKVMTDKATGVSRGFGFLNMSSEAEVESIMANYDNHMLDGKWIEVKRCQSKDQYSGKGKGSAWGSSGKGSYGKGSGYGKGGYGAAAASYPAANGWGASSGYGMQSYAQPAAAATPYGGAAAQGYGAYPGAAAGYGAAASGYAQPAAAAGAAGYGAYGQGAATSAYPTYGTAAGYGAQTAGAAASNYASYYAQAAQGARANPY